MLKKLVSLFALLLLGLFGSAAHAQGAMPTASFEIKDSGGQSVGTVMLTQTAAGVNVKGTFKGLPAGVHGIHFHAVGACTPDFAAAGAHYNPMSKQHGLENPAGAHGGDLGNLTIGADGSGAYDYTTMLVSLMPGDMTLYDADGSALVVHANPDDYKTDPSGNSGGRIACGVVTAAAVPVAAPATPAAPATLPNTGLPPAYEAAFLTLALIALGGGLLMVRRSRAQR